jgi:putative hydrolase of the HAD superfamily
VQQRLALFDLDGTLVDRQAAFSHAVTSLCRAHGFDTSVEQWLFANLADRANPSHFTQLRADCNLTESAADLWQEYVHLMAAAVSCSPAVLEGLAQLRAAAWTIGIATNGASDIQRAKLAAAGLSNLVDGVAVSGDIEIRKPDRRLFELAAARSGLALTDGGWMIGDNPTADIGGGHQAGLHTIWLRGRHWPEGLPAACRTVADATSAINLLLNENPE